MDQHSVIGLDLAKSVFQVHVADTSGKKLLSKKLKRAELASQAQLNLPGSMISGVR